MSRDPAAPPPTLPPPPGPDPSLMFERVTEMFLILAVFAAVTLVAVRVLGPLARAWARKLEGKVGDPELPPPGRVILMNPNDVAPRMMMIVRCLTVGAAAKEASR